MKKKLLLPFCTIATFITGIPLIVSAACSENTTQIAKNTQKITENSAQVKENSEKIREEYFSVVEKYSDTLNDFQAKIDKIRKTNPKSDTDEIAIIISEAQAKIDPLIDQANYLFKKLHELEKKKIQNLKL
ncbi:hypothetical protein [Mesomycoplasma hyopneumoniae]|uniref:hypothetical protein n=1 Tax=Mesomycoplasma hyopneumoniae TaxID=2099 RepID=UPI0038576E93